MKLWQRLKLCCRILSANDRDKNQSWLIREIPDDGELRDLIEEVLLVLSTQGHSRASMEVVLPILVKAIRREPLTPLTGNDDEWENVADISGQELYQNKRYPSVFKDQTGAWDLNGTYYEDNLGCFRNRHSRKTVTFPYMPTGARYIKYTWYVKLCHIIKDKFC